MRTALGVLMIVVVSAVPALAEDFKCTVYTADNQKLNATLTDEDFGIRTPYGTLKVPTKDILTMYPGFSVAESSRRRIASSILKLGSPNADATVRSLVGMGRMTVPQLQKAAESSNKEVAKNAKAALKVIWPVGVRVPSDGSAVLLTKEMELRGTLTWLSVRLEGDFGRKSLLRAGIYLMQFTGGKVQPAPDVPKHPPLKEGRYPELELVLEDNTRIIGTLDDATVDVETDYGKLTVPVKKIISVTLGDPDRVVTRDMTFTGKLVTTALEVKSKVGTFRIDRDKVTVVKAVLDETATAVATTDEDVEPNQWFPIFNGTDLKGWSSWGDDAAKVRVENGEVRMTGDAGMTYQKLDEVPNVIVAAQVRIDKTLGQGGGVKVILRDTTSGQYYIHFEGRQGMIARWDNKKQTSQVLKTFRATAPPDGWHRIQFGILGSMMLAYVNGEPVGEVKIDPKDQLPPGRIGVGVWHADATFKDIRVKVLE